MAHEPIVLGGYATGRGWMRKFRWSDHDRWITEEGKIVGRMFGDPPVCAYQLAGSPYDPPQVAGFQTFEAAFMAAIKALTGSGAVGVQQI